MSKVHSVQEGRHPPAVQVKNDLVFNIGNSLSLTFKRVKQSRPSGSIALRTLKCSASTYYPYRNPLPDGVLFAFDTHALFLLPRTLNWTPQRFRMFLLACWRDLKQLNNFVQAFE